MKGSFSILSALFPLLLLCFSAVAQEELQVIETPDPSHRELNLDEDKILIYDHPSHTSVVRDTIQTIQRIAPATHVKSSRAEAGRSAKKDKEDEEALKFNFLYYMLQKFKLSDLVDQ